MTDRVLSTSSLAIGGQPPAASDFAPVSADFSRRDWLRRQQAVVAIGRRAVNPPTLSILMQDSAALIAEILGLEWFGTAEPSRDRQALQLTLAVRQPDSGEGRTLTRTLSVAGGESLVGFALQEAHPVVVPELAEADGFHDPFLLEHGIRGALAVPLVAQKQSFGALIAASSRPCRPEKEDLLFVETVAHLITTTIARSNTEQVLAEERYLAGGMLQAIDALVLIVDAGGRITHVNAACQRATGFSSEDVRGRPIWTVFPVPGEAEQFRAAFRKLRKGTNRIEYETTLLTKHADRRRVAWACAVVRKADGTIDSIIITGIDVTERREAEERALRAEKEVEATRLAVAAPLEILPEGLPPEEDGDPSSVAQRAAARRGLPAGVPVERRRRPRRSYPYHQLVAPILDGKLPGERDFVRVRCNDIAAGGFSFLASEPPPSNALIVALGNAPNLTHVTAQVVHVTRVKRRGKFTYLVGCGYTGRVRY